MAGHLPRQLKILFHRFHRRPRDALGGMVVHHAHRLHEGISRGGADKLPPPLFQRFGQGLDCAVCACSTVPSLGVVGM